MTLSDLKNTARSLFLAGVRAADPALAVQRALDAEPVHLGQRGQLFIIAFGKASCAMMEQALKHVPIGQAVQALAVTNPENLRAIDGCRVMPSSHPLPDQNGIDAGNEIKRLLRSATTNDQVLCLISGGGSALVPTPRPGLTLGDKIRVNEVLLEGGLDIVQMNRVRQQLSVLKGGGLLDLAHPAAVRSLIISDVVGDDLSIVASGPTAPAIENFDNEALLKANDLWELLPSPAQALLRSSKPTTLHTAQNELVCTNSQSLQAIAQATSDWNPRIMPDPLVGDVSDAAEKMLGQIQAMPLQGSQMLIWGGETTVKITGSGRGGRNQELAVRFAKRAQDFPGDWVFLSGGTDGRDGPTDAAGGVVDAQTLAKAEAHGTDVAAALNNNDSYRILEAADDLLITGATGTNVADIQIFLRTMQRP